MSPTGEAAEMDGAKSVPRFWLYAGPMNLVCQWCDTDIFRSPEDADLADLEKAVKAAKMHVCPLTVAEVDALAHRAHFGQVDKLGVPYIWHVRTVAAGLKPFGAQLQMAGLLHDVIEDTDWTADSLAAQGIPDVVVAIVQAVTNTPGIPYRAKIRSITKSREATLVKISDNAHNSHPTRLAALDEETRTRLEKKYRDARKILWNAVDADEVRKILKIVNTDLLAEL